MSFQYQSDCISEQLSSSQAEHAVVKMLTFVANYDMRLVAIFLIKEFFVSGFKFSRAQVSKIVTVSAACIIAFSASAQLRLPEYLELNDAKIVNDRISSGTRVWNTITKQVILSADHPVTLTTSSAFYTDGSVTYIHNADDGTFITQIPGKDYKFNLFSNAIWKHSDNQFSAYSEMGEALTALTLSGSNIFTTLQEVWYTRNDSLFLNNFNGPGEQFLTKFSGTFKAWFGDGEYYLTLQSTLLRLYTKTGSLVKIIDLPVADKVVGGFGSYIWTYDSWIGANSNLEIYRVDDNSVWEHDLNDPPKVTPKYLGLLPYGEKEFSIVSLTGAVPEVSEHQGAGPYLRSFNADLNGNWTTANETGVVNYGTMTSDPEKLNLGRVRSMHGDKNNKLAMSTASGHVLVYQFVDGQVNEIDTLELNVSKILLSRDGTRLVAMGNDDAHQYDADRSLYVYDLTDMSLLRTWPYDASIYTTSPVLADFDFSFDGSTVSQMLQKSSGLSVSYINFLAHVDQQDSIGLNTTQNSSAPKLAADGGHALTSVVESGTGANDLCKMYNDAGVLVNGINGASTGWIDDTRFLLNKRYQQCTPMCSQVEVALIYNRNGMEESGYSIPDQIYINGNLQKTKLVNTFNVINDTVLFVKSTNVIDLKSGSVLFALDTVPAKAASFGPYHIAYIDSNALKVINWKSSASKLWYADADGDGFGNAAVTKVYFTQPEGFVENNLDCNDSDGTLNPTTIWYGDADGDGYGDPGESVVQCEAPADFVKSNTDCDDTDSELNPETIWYSDADGDGYGDPADSLVQCTQPETFVRNNDDCNDGDEILNQNTVWYRDADGDGFGDPDESVINCVQPTGFVSDSTDCDDTNETMHGDMCTVGVGEPVLQIGEVFPNPGSGLFLLRHNNRKLDISVFDNVGQKVSVTIDRNDTHYDFDMSQNADGIFHIHASDGETIRVIKVLKRQGN